MNANPSDLPERFRFRDRSRFFLWIRFGAVPLALIVAATGCQGNRLFGPVASNSIDTSRPSIYGPSFDNDPRGSVRQDQSGQVRVTSENAVPETEIAPVEQRLATAKRAQPAPTSPSESPAFESTSARGASRSVQSHRPQTDSQTDSQTYGRQTGVQAKDAGYQPTDTTQPINQVALEMPAELGGVDVTELMKALQDAPPEVQKAAIGRLIAMSRQHARTTTHPASIEDALAASFDSLPTLPDQVIDRGVNPTRLASGEFVYAPTTPTSPTTPIERSGQPSPASNVVAKTASPAFAVQPIATTEMSFSDNAMHVHPVAAEQTESSDAVSRAVLQSPVLTELVANTVGHSKPEHSRSEHSKFGESVTNESPLTITSVAKTEPVTNPIEKMTDADLFDALVSRLQTAPKSESEANRHRRTVMSRHLMVLSGDPDRAVEKIEGLSNEEEEFLRHQLLGLWTIIDPNGHPVASRRLSSALPEMRKATGFLAAASDSLEVRGLEFCTEIEAYGEVTPFKSRAFQPGQEIILYCEVENFIAANVDDGFETRLQGSYDLLDRNGRRISSQTLPEDRQVSKNQLRDYFVAYQMYLPDEIAPGNYQLRLTMEDIHGKKYGQSTIDFEIKR